MFDYRLLQALAAVLDEGSFEKAARTLHLTQSAVSQRIRQLEALLGQPVLVRSSPPRATAVGQRLHNHTQQVRQLEAELGIGESRGAMTIPITVNADSLATWLPAALVLANYPEVGFNISVEDQAVGLRRMKQGEVMACLCASAERVNGGRVVPLGKLRYRAVASPAFVARYRLDPPGRRELVEAPCLIFSRDDPLQHWFLKDVADAEPKRIHYCPSSEGFVQAALVGLGYGLMPEIQIRDHLDAGRLVDLVPGYVLDTPLYWHHWQTETAVMAELRQSVTAAAGTHLRP